MQKIPLPSKVEIQEDKKNKNKARIIIEPCFPGYGLTLGNPLRRVLLSSLPGAAPYAVRIKGADHEFMGLPYIKEDVMDIILNIKQLCLKIFTDEPVILKIEAKGKKRVKAGDIKKNPQVEITNPDLEIATLTDEKAELEMEIWVDKGLGYLPVEERKEKIKEIGVISVDSIYTPVIQCGFRIKNVRVGERTDYDKIIFDLETDGTITPKEAINKASNILVNQFEFIRNFTEEKKKKEKVMEGEEKKKKEAGKKKMGKQTGEEKKIEKEKTETKAKKPVEKRKRGRPKKI